MRKINVYCGWLRDTVVTVKPRIIDDVVFEIPCLECGGTGIWDSFFEEFPAEKCDVCKGTGKQYLGA